MNRGEWTKKSNMNSLLLQWNATAKLADKNLYEGDILSLHPTPSDWCSILY